MGFVPKVNHIDMVWMLQLRELCQVVLVVRQECHHVDGHRRALELGRTAGGLSTVSRSRRQPNTDNMPGVPHKDTRGLRPQNHLVILGYVHGLFSGNRPCTRHQSAGSGQFVTEPNLAPLPRLDHQRIVDLSAAEGLVQRGINMWNAPTGEPTGARARWQMYA